MTEISSTEYAFRLRWIGRIGGMLYHPEADKVFGPERRRKMWKIIIPMRVGLPITDEEFDDFCYKGADRLNVVWNSVRRRYEFARSDTGEAKGDA